MTVPKFSLSGRYAIQEGDGLLLLFADSNRSCFEAELIPEPVRRNLLAPSEPGGAQTVFRGQIGRCNVLARAVRLDTPGQDLQSALRKAVGTAVHAAREEAVRRLVVPLQTGRDDLVLAVQEGALLGGYLFDRYLSQKPRLPTVVAVIRTAGSARLKAETDRQATIFENVNFARDAGNEPPNVLRPPQLARLLQRQGQRSGLAVTVWDEKRLEREGCGAILAVGRGASARPRLVIGEYRPRRARRHLCLVGKGVTFDTGGYCLKPADFQVPMKYDMNGAAATFAAACALARLGVALQVTVITPLVENAISGESLLAASILTTRSGRTIEVHNTDAEGRLILADALALAVERRPDWLIDCATLTGACVVGLGTDIAGVYGTHPELTRAFIDAGNRVGENFWELPLYFPYAEQLKTVAADCKNMGNDRYGGSIIAALFLRQWIPEGMPWLHCDIAGPGCKEEPLGHLGKGAKGFAVKTLVALGRQLAAGGS